MRFCKVSFSKAALPPHLNRSQFWGAEEGRCCTLRVPEALYNLEAWPFKAGTFRACLPLRICLLFTCGLLALGGLGAVASAAAADPLLVTNTQDSGPGSLRAALQSTQTLSGATIRFDPTVFAARQTVTLTSGNLQINVPLTIQGPAAGVVLDGSHLSASYGSILTDYLDAPGVSYISGLILKNGSNSGLLNQFGTLYATNCTVTGSTASSGGGVFNDGTLILRDCTISNNTASQAGGGLFNYGTVTLINSTLAGNSSGGPGGGVYNGNSGAVLALTNCTVTGNTAGSSGGGGISSLDGTLTLLNCTFTGNEATTDDGNVYGGGGALALVRGTTTLRNTILYGDTSPQGGGNEIFFNNNGPANGTVTADFCDIAQSDNYTGVGDFDADPKLGPLQDNGGPTQTQALLAGSPCLGIAAPAPAADERGAPRLRAGRSLPDIGAYQAGSNPFPSGHTHLLWDNTDGTAALWNVSLATGAFTQAIYGPYAHWAAKAVSDGGPDGQTRLLWTNTNGTAALWNIDADTGSLTRASFGPYSGWTTEAVSVGSDNVTHLLWRNTSGKAALWNVVGSQYQTEHDYGPYSGWTAKAIADGSDGLTRLLWTNTNGEAACWTVDASTGGFHEGDFGPYSGWTAQAVSVSATTTHLLWRNTNGTQAVWNYDPSTGSVAAQNYGPYAGWTAKAIADGSDGQARLLWTNTTGAASAWSLDNATGVFGAFTFGPYSGWTAQAISSGE